MDHALQQWLDQRPDWEQTGPVEAAPSPSSPPLFSIEPLQQCLKALALLPFSVPVLHVVGSKGKGTVSSMVAQLLAAHGQRVGLYQSPHLLERRERISINGIKISEATYAAQLQRVRDSGCGDDLSRFEIDTAAALAHFVQSQVDCIVLEAGLGGITDATHAVPAQVVVLTSVELEHTAVLGHTLAEIALQKAGVVAPEATIVTGPLPPEARAVVAALVAKRRCHWSPFESIALSVTPHAWGSDIVVGWSSDVPTLRFSLSLLGQHQGTMAGVALLAARAWLADRGVPWRDDAAQSLAAVQLPGRLQLLQVSPPLLLDVAHTPLSTAAAVAACLAHLGKAPDVVMLGINRDKPFLALLQPLLATTSRLLLVPNPGPRGALPAQLVSQLPSPLPLAVESFASWQEGWAHLRTHIGPAPALILGSFQLAGAIYKSYNHEQ